MRRQDLTKLEMKEGFSQHMNEPVPLFILDSPITKTSKHLITHPVFWGVVVLTAGSLDGWVHWRAEVDPDASKM